MIFRPGLSTFLPFSLIIMMGCDGQDGRQNVAEEGFMPLRSDSMPSVCVDGSVGSGNPYNVIGDSIHVRSGPGTSFDKIVNRKLSEIMKETHYISIDDSVIVFEECTSGEWSYIRVTEPDWLRDSHRGWVLSTFLDKGQPDPTGDKYSRKISSIALDPYTKESYPTTVSIYGTRLLEIEVFRRQSAEMSIDSGKCDFVEMVELSDKKSSLGHLEFWVDCRNGQRIYLDENQLRRGGGVLTQAEKAWSEASARAACKSGIQGRALLPSELSFHEILGTTFYEAPQTHNVSLIMDFEAVNAFGVEINYTATCHFEPGELGTIDIQPRR